MPPRARPFLAICFALLACCLGAAPADAQSWPSRPITLLVAFPPGTTTDYAARAIAQELTKELGQTVVVENRTGGGGVIAALSVAKAPPDGYTLLMTAIGPAVLRPLIDAKLQVDPVAGFTPLALVGEAPNLIAVSPRLGVNSIPELVAYAKRNPGKLTIGHSGPGTMGHLIALLFASEAGFDANYIAYAGSPPIITDLGGGHIDVGSIAYGASVGTAKVLAVTTRERVSFLPDVPTMRESGFPNVIGATWAAMYGPAKMPPQIVTRLNTIIDGFLQREETHRLFAKVGYRALGGPPERLRQQMADDRAKWSKVIAAAHISVEQ